MMNCKSKFKSITKVQRCEIASKKGIVKKTGPIKKMTGKKIPSKME